MITCWGSFHEKGGLVCRNMKLLPVNDKYFRGNSIRHHIHHQRLIDHIQFSQIAEHGLEYNYEKIYHAFCSVDELHAGILMLYFS